MAWALARAFGPAEAESPPATGAGAVASARSLDLSARIATRVSEDRLVAELGAAAAAELLRDRMTAAALALRLDAAFYGAAAACARVEAPFVPLKGRALVLGGWVTPEARATTDVDLLLPAAMLGPVREELGRSGFHDSGGAAYEHQLAPLIHEDGGVVELHRSLPGVRLEGGRSATFEAIERSGGFEAANGGAGPRRLRRELLVAHALVHTLAQHGFAAAHPGLRLVADLIDLGGRGEIEPLLGANERAWIDTDLEAEEVAATLELVEALSAGEALPGRQRAAGLLLDHFLACAFDRRYGARLRLRFAERPLSDRPLARARWSALRAALLPARRRSPAGGEESWARYLARWLGRPARLLRRLAGGRDGPRG